MKLETRDYCWGDMVARYLFDRDSGSVSLVLLPAGRADRFSQRRRKLGSPELVRIGMDPDAWHVGCLTHLSLRHLPKGKGAGCTLKYGTASENLRFSGQEQEGNTVTTWLRADGYRIAHRLQWLGTCWQINTTFYNDGAFPVTLDLLTSFSLDNLSPFATEEENGLRLHRFRGGWSMEGLHTVDSIRELNLAAPWTYSFPESERFGGIGSHPVKRYFPVCAVEDPREGVFWGACVSAAASWQMELSRDSDCYSLSGGLGDNEFAGWSRTVLPGSCFDAPDAWVAVGNSLDRVCADLTGMYEKPLESQSEQEQSLPVIFNEWCTTWGNPSHERMLALADRLSGTGIQYLVIDAGWTDVIPNSFGQGGNGDWAYARDRFPGGLLATSRALKEKGFVTGIWFEFEVTTRGAKVYGHDWDEMHLKHGGAVIDTGDGRSFWDFRRPDVIRYLRRHVLDFLRDNEIGYLKVDYNASIGAGCDGGSSPADGLYEQMNAVLAFFDLLRRELPNLVIESCASGGHRLTAPFLRRCAMASFSDAHECPEIPVIAARLHRLMLPRQMQIWAVINPDQSLREISYRLSSGFLGRLCLSGSIDGLSDAQFDMVTRAVKLYEKAAPVIRNGVTTVFGPEDPYLRKLTGWQGVVRIGDGWALVVAHIFREAPEPAAIPLKGSWCMEDSLAFGIRGNLTAEGLAVCGEPNSGGVFLLRAGAYGNGTTISEREMNAEKEC